MNKCKCIMKSTWFLIDDSFDPNSDIGGGPFSFEKDETYQYYIEDSFFGKCFHVVHPENGINQGFDENKFLEHFIVIDHVTS